MTPSIAWSPRTDAWLVLGLTLLALGVRLIALGHAPLWEDEQLTFVFITSPLSDLLGPKIALETNPPVYYLLQKSWLIFGTSRFAMRSLPVLVGSAIVPVIYLLGRRLGGRRVALVAAALFVSAPVHVAFAREIRCYPFVTLAASGALTALLYLLPALHADGARADEQRGRSWLWAAYVVTLAMATVLHNTGVLVVLLMLAIAVTDAALRRTFDRRFFLALIGFTALACVPFLFWLPNLVGQALGPHGGAVSWIPKPTPRFVYDCLAGVYSTPKLAKPLLVGAALASLWLVREHRRVVAVLLIILAGQPALLLVGSLIQPMLLVRTLVWPTVLFFVLLALGIARLRWRALQLGAIGALTVLQLYQHLPEFTSPDAPEIMAAAARAIEERATPQDVVVAIPDSLHIDLIYAWRGNAARGIPRYFGSYGDEHDQIAPWLRGKEIARADFIDIARDRSRAGGAVWLVTEAQPLFPIPPDQTPAPLIEQLKREGWTLLTSQHDNIVVTRISCSDAACMPP